MKVEVWHDNDTKYFFKLLLIFEETGLKIKFRSKIEVLEFHSGDQ